jgi:hypothetical protein
MLHRHAEDLWTVDYELRIAPGLPFPTRMTVVRLEGGTLALISPIPIDDALSAELANLGPVSHLVAPNLLHHLHLPGARQRYAAARLLAPLGLATKKPDLAFEPLETANAPVFREAFATEAIAGAPTMAETALLHRASRSLIVADLVFNIETPPSWTTSALLWCTGTRGRLAQSRVWAFTCNDARAAEASRLRILGWDFDRLVVAHGNIIDVGAKARLASVFLGALPHAMARA